MYTYADSVAFVLWQLEHYNLTCSRAVVGEIAGCSATTVRKYDKETLTPQGGRRMNKNLVEKLKGFPFPNKQIKTIYDDEVDYIWIAGENGPYQKKKNPPVITALDDLTVINPKLKYFNNNFEYPATSGLYMLAQVVCIPHRLNERYFLIKVGMSETNLNNRIKSYAGVNPFAICIDIQRVPPNNVKHYENNWHKAMDKQYQRMGNTEWFIVPYEDYLRFLEFGFDIKL